MFKRISYLLCALVLLSGCVTVNIPNYIKDEHSYKKKFDADYDAVLKATTDMLASFRWNIEGEAQPSVFETVKDIEDADNRQTLLFSNVRQTGFFIGSKYSRVNVFLRGYKKEFTDMEIRFVAITSILFKRFTGYRQDALAKRMFDQIQKNLNAISISPEPDGQIPSTE